MSDRPILTIAIPVFNGQKNLKLTLHSIFDGNESSNEFEVLVSDNASTDETPRIIEDYEDRHSSNLRVNTNATNIGYDRNIDLLVEQSNGLYVWFVGCGEVIAPRSISNILSYLRKDSFDTIVLNFDVFEEATKKIATELSYPDCHVRMTTDRDDFSFPRYCPAVSANIVNRQKWLAVSVNGLGEIGWCHIERILDMIASKDFKKSLFIPDKSFTLYRDIDGWWTKSNGYEYLLKHISIIRSMDSRGFALKLVSRLDNKLSKYALLVAVLQAKSNGFELSADVFYKFKKMFGNKAFFWFVILPAMVTPQCVARSILNLKKAIH